MQLSLTQSQTAQLLNISPRRFARELPDMIMRGFPPPYIGDLNNGRTGPRRRWMRAAIVQWMSLSSISAAIHTPQGAANDRLQLDAAAKITAGLPRGDLKCYHANPISNLKPLKMEA